MSDNPLSERRAQAAHLLRRAGFGGTPSEIDELAALSHVEAVEKLLNFKYDGSLAFNLERKLRESGYEAGLNDIAYWWMLTMARTRQPLQEKMTLFWHGHFTSSFAKTKDPMLLLQQNQLYRDNALGNFKDFTKKVSHDPAMIDYLDGQSNRKGKPNENYARELLELFTIGIGNYSEQDIREAARAFTGWGFRDRSFYFTPALHDTDKKTFMGQTGNFDGDDIVNIITSKRETAQTIATKLWKFFVYDEPEAAVVERITEVFFKSGYNLKELMRAILTAPEFLSEKAFRALVKSPVEYTIGMLKQLGTGNIEANVARATSIMGQTVFNPPTVKGWDGGLSWINSAYFFERINTANQLVVNRGQQGFRYNPYDLLGLGQDQSAGSAQAVIDRIVGVFLDGNTQPEIKDALAEYLSDGKSLKASDFTAAAANNNAQGKALDVRLRGTLHLVLSAPDYMLK